MLRVIKDLVGDTGSNIKIGPWYHGVSGMSPVLVPSSHGSCQGRTVCVLF